MEVKILSQKQNPALKRTEVTFQIDHSQTGSTPSRRDVRRAVAVALKTDENTVFVKRFVTKTGMHTVAGLANVYESAEHAKLIEPEHIVKRNAPPPPEKPEEQKEEVKT